MKYNELKAGTVFSYISMGLGFIVSIAYTPIMLRLLGQSEYGLYKLVASVVAYLGVLNFGFGSAYIRYYSRYKVRNDADSIAKINGMFLIIFIALGIIAVFAGIILTLHTRNIFGSELTSIEVSKAKMLMLILVVNIAMSFPNIVFVSHITANEKFVFYRLTQMVKTVVNPFVVLPILLLGYGSVGMVAVTTVLNLSIEIIYIIYCNKKLNMKFKFNNLDLSLFKEMTVFSSFIFMNIVIDQINWNVDKFILGRLYGTISVAVYGLAAQLNTYYLTIASTVSSVFIPRINRIVASTNSNRELTKLFTKIGRVQFIILSVIFMWLIFFGRAFINIWAGSDYDGSYPIVLLLILPVTIPLIQNIGIEIQRAKNMHKFRSWVYLFIAIANLGITIPLAKKYGGMGAAMGTGIALVIGNGIVMNWYYSRRIGLDIKYFWKQILMFAPSYILPVVTGVLLIKYIDISELINVLIASIIFISIMIVSIWQFGMNQYEKELIGKPLKRAYNRIVGK